MTFYKNAKYYLVKAAVLMARGVSYLGYPLKIITKAVFLPLEFIFKKVVFQAAVIPIYKIYKRIRREISKGEGTLLLLTENKYLQHLFVILVGTVSLFYSVALKSFAAEDLSSKAVVLDMIRSEGDREFLIKEEDLTEDRIGLGYIPLGFEDFNRDDEEIFALIAGGGAFVRPLAPTSSIGPRTRLDVENYKVETGDTIGGIADKFGISINTVLWANNLSVRSVLRPGQELKILPTSGVLYKVKRGDTVDKIANTYKGDVERIFAFNNLSSASLSIGQELIIPDGRIPPPPPAPRQQTPTFIPSFISGKMFWPVGSRRITQYFWWRHAGVDIGAPTGTPIYASDDGIVEFVKYGRTGYGYQVMVNHGNGVRTRYAHASRILVVPGQQVRKGEVIANVGSTGRSTGPHIHYEIFIGAKRVNPLQYIR